jgi:signal transduction histidine kinase
LRESAGSYPIRCWEWLSCTRKACEAYGSDDLRCWLIPHTCCFDGSIRLAERLSSKCAACPVFLSNRVRSTGKRYSDQAIIDTLDALFAEGVTTMSRMKEIEIESRSKSEQVTLLSEVGKALQSTMDIDDLLQVILTAVTAGDGLGFNRAFLLLVDDTDSTLKGRMAVGPTDPSEADTIWKAMKSEARSLGEILSELWADGKSRNEGIRRLAEKMIFRMDDPNVMTRALEEGRSYVLDDCYESGEAREIGRILGNDHFLVVPLIAKAKRLGCILADNFVTGRRISVEDVRLLETFASQAALAILNAALHSKLMDRIRQLEQAHEDLSQNQLQLLRAERVVAAGGLAAAFIHDLKAPLVSVGLLARTSAGELAEGEPTRDRFLKIAQEIVEIEKYLKHVARSAVSRSKKAGPIDISALLTGSLELMKSFMTRCGIESNLDLNHGDCKVMGDTVEFRQAILNLLYNSVEAMPDGGKLTLRTETKGDMVNIRIRDTGEGIPESVRGRVFSPFFTTKTEGSGLGLVIARRTINDYGGTISFESKEGKGTCFSIMLPAC